MNIYVDFDDCLCETAKAFSKLVREMFGIRVPYEKMWSFNLQQSFGLTDEQYQALLIRGHEPEVLLSYEETPGASQVLNEWVRAGHQVSVVTGRPSSSYELSRLWLDRHGMTDAELFCLDKYGREKEAGSGSISLKLEDYYRMPFDFAVEDSPAAFRFFDHLPKLQVFVYDRPWNRTPALPGSNYHRCCSWAEINARLTEQSGRLSL